jgi:gas vesicle protein
MADECGGNGILWFLAGLGIGAAVGVLYAPKSGQETRDAIRTAAEEGSGVVRERARVYREQAKDWVDKGKNMVDQQKEQIRTAFEAGRQAYREATQDAAPEPTAPKS